MLSPLLVRTVEKIRSVDSGAVGDGLVRFVVVSISAELVEGCCWRVKNV